MRPLVRATQLRTFGITATGRACRGVAAGPEASIVCTCAEGTFNALALS